MASFDLDALPDEVLQFLADRHLATLTTIRADGSPHVSPIGFSYDPAARTVRIITFAAALKVRNAARGGRAAVCQVDGPRWLTLEGVATVTSEPEPVRLALDGYAARYRPPSDRADRMVIEIMVDRIMGRA
jgi:F420H(2)-dependent biliverdin reductase